MDKTVYLDIMEKSLSAYTEQRIRDYIDEVKRDGLREHGFPRLGVNIGILISYGRRCELKDTFIEIMDICCDQMPRVKAANDFSIREVCCCLSLCREKQTVDSALIDKWISLISTFNPWTNYNVIAPSPDTPDVSNWALFAAVSEYTRGVLCGIDTTEFVDWQISSQLLNLDENGMYQDDAPIKNPMVYDIVPRGLFAFLLSFGYNGKYAKAIEDTLDKTADISLFMQSATGEIPFGGRSNQFLNNEPMYISYYEMEAARFARKGDVETAARLKEAARTATDITLKYLSLDPISHIKNRYDIQTRFGCEDYGYFNKYMITVASNVYMGFLFADDSIVPSVSPAQNESFVLTLSEHFHKTFLGACGYTAQIETNADIHYDGNGIGRIHKVGCPAALCLSVPFPAARPNYRLEQDNKSEMSLCCYVRRGDTLLHTAKKGVRYTLLDTAFGDTFAEATYEIALSDEIALTQKITLCENGVDITVCGEGDVGFMVPVFDFDGASHTKINESKNSILVQYDGASCLFGFDGGYSPEYDIYCNRNGRYRVYTVSARHLHIVMKEG